MKAYTTGQVAKFCQVSLQTVSRWVDSGWLEGFRIPVSKHRRIPRETLIKFLEDHGVPLPDELKDDEVKD